MDGKGLRAGADVNVAAAACTDRRLRLGIVGAGMIAVTESGFLPGLTLMRDRVLVTAITSRTRARAEAVAHGWQIPAVFDDVDQMLAGADIDAVLNRPRSTRITTST